MYIDIGQKTFNKSVQCNHCNFFYLMGDVDDEKEHAKYCATMGQPIQCKFSKGNVPKKVHNFDQWAAVVEFHPSVMKTDKSLKIVASQMKDDMGFDIATVDDENETLQLYIYLDDGNILGVLFFERIAKHSTHLISHEIEKRDTKKEDTCTPQSTTTESSQSSSSPTTHGPSLVDISLQGFRAQEYTLGVRYIWVHKKWRRKGIASSLCDIARRKTEYGKVIEKSAISFSQPTSCGMNFATSYTKTSSISTYS